MKTITLKVEGMHCEGCSSRIEKSLLSMEGVKDVKANHQTNEVIVTLAEEHLEEVKERLDNLNFPVIGE